MEMFGVWCGVARSTSLVRLCNQRGFQVWQQALMETRRSSSGSYRPSDQAFGGAGLRGFPAISLNLKRPRVNLPAHITPAEFAKQYGWSERRVRERARA